VTKTCAFQYGSALRFNVNLTQTDVTTFTIKRDNVAGRKLFSMRHAETDELVAKMVMNSMGAHLQFVHLYIASEMYTFMVLTIVTPLYHELVSVVE